MFSLFDLDLEYFAGLQSDSILFESLRRLQLMELSVEVLKVMLEHMFQNNGEFEKPWENGGTPENDVPHRKQQPPKQYVIPKEKAETRRQEPSQFITPEGKEVTRRQLPPHSAIVEDKSQMKQQKTVMRPGKPQVPGIGQGRCDGIENRQSKPVLLDSGPGRPPKLPHTQNAGRQMKPKQHQDSGALRRKLTLTYLIILYSMQKTKCSEESLIREKLELAKRKLHEGYQQAENGMYASVPGV
ncbi:hypothetical protein GW17_00023636 [Ensete ventricosum]|nr:hypothetical protein GW17_00023636 [Ensete ventricosum]